MVLPGRLGGRVGRRRILFYRNPPFRYGWGIFCVRAKFNKKGDAF
jgi:hypothetical protein